MKEEKGNGTMHSRDTRYFWTGMQRMQNVQIHINDNRDGETGKDIIRQFCLKNMTRCTTVSLTTKEIRKTCHFAKTIYTCTCIYRVREDCMKGKCDVDKVSPEVVKRLSV
jgi:hypothetical protein